MLNRMTKHKVIFLLLLTSIQWQSCLTENTIIWQIGENDNDASEFALAPNGYSEYIANDFGWEDKYFLIGTSNAESDWPYIIPGTSDTWGGTWTSR